MKKIILAAFVSLVALGSASADGYSDYKHDQVNLANLPATAADRSTQTTGANLQEAAATVFPGADLR